MEAREVQVHLSIVISKYCTAAGLIVNKIFGVPTEIAINENTEVKAEKKKSLIKSVRQEVQGRCTAKNLGYSENKCAG